MSACARPVEGADVDTVSDAFFSESEGIFQTSPLLKSGSFTCNVKVDELSSANSMGKDCGYAL